MDSSDVNSVVVLGPTASGKTRLGVGIARAFDGEIVSADSRQVYRGLTIGAGKDLEEYRAGGPPVPYHLIDVVDLDHEFSVFEYQRLFYQAFEEIWGRNVLPVVVGGTGLYVEAVLNGYRMVEVPEDPELRRSLEGLSHEQLVVKLTSLKPDLHNTTDLDDRDRLVRAIEIATHSQDRDSEPAPEIRPVVLGTRWPRPVLRKRIAERLDERLNHGLIEEVDGLAATGVPWEKFEFLGLEYRFVAQYLQGKLASRDDLFEKLKVAIGQFAKRQESWFRRMERRGTRIHWIDKADPDAAQRVVAAALDSR